MRHSSRAAVVDNRGAIRGRRSRDHAPPPTSVLIGPDPRRRRTTAHGPVRAETDGPGSWLATAAQTHHVPISTAQRLTVRAFDVVVSLAALVFFSPVMLALLLLVASGSTGPSLFAHERIGRHGETFRCLKFRSMFSDAGDRLTAVLASDAGAAAQWREFQKIRNDPRITPIGRMLRRTNLDELPQLLNVLRGEMSIVGPRPIVAEESRRFGPALPTVLSVKPGLTGLWQVSGRSDTTYERRVHLDVAYVQTRSLALDVMICAKTAVQMLRPGSNGAY